MYAFRIEVPGNVCFIDIAVTGSDFVIGIKVAVLLMSQWLVVCGGAGC